MSTYPDYKLKREALEKAQTLLGGLRRYYRLSKDMQSVLKLYTDNVDTYFRAAVNYTYTADQRAEIGQMFITIDNLVVNWETNHKEALDLVNGIET